MKCLPEPLRFSTTLREVRVARPQEDSVRQRELIEKEAFERGKREGEKALSEQLLRQRSDLLQLQQGVLQSLKDLLPEISKECEKTLVAVALEAAQRFVGGLPITSEMIEAMVREALARVQESSEFTVMLHAEDLELLQHVNSPMLLAEVGGNRIRFVAGREVTRGGCIVQTRFGTIDARRETKMELLKKSLEI